jgi:hypothetical protein
MASDNPEYTTDEIVEALNVSAGWTAILKERIFTISQRHWTDFLALVRKHSSIFHASRILHA